MNNFKKRHSKQLNIILETLSKETWENLSSTIKTNSLESCSGCMNDKKLKIALFSLPSKSNILISKTKNRII